MAEIEQQIAFYHTGYLICLIIMAAAFALAVFFFIKFKIPQAISLMSGRSREKSVEKMKKSGVLRNESDKEKESFGGMAPEYQDAATEDYSTEKINPKADILKTEGAGVSMDTEYFRSADEEPLTTVLDGNEETLTTILGDQGASGEAGDSAGKTQKLSRQAVTFEAPEPIQAAVRFEMIEHSVVVHTDEFI